MSWFSINLNNESIVLASDQGVQESDLVIIFFFDGKGAVIVVPGSRRLLKSQRSRAKQFVAMNVVSGK